MSLPHADGPSIELGPYERFVLLNDRLSLVCGAGLDSNPRATITWRAPNGTTIANTHRHILENGPEIVRLNFTHAVKSDSGVWKCNIHVMAPEKHTVSDGKIGDIVRDVSIGKEIMHNIRLTIVSKRFIS